MRRGTPPRERRSALGLVGGRGILVDEDLLLADRMGDALGALLRFLADDDFFGDARLLVDVDRLAAERHLDAVQWPDN